MTDYIKREDAIVAYANHEVDVRQGKFEDYRQYMRNVLRSVESADVAPVRHGRWKLDRSGRGVNCSRCDMWMPFTMLPYCPYCGARMDGDDDENRQV